MNPQLTTSLIERQENGLHESQLGMVAFQLDRQVYTLPIDIIYQIIDMVALTRIPEANDLIEGIFNYHGTTVPVIDLRKYLNLPKIPVHLHTPIILVAFSEQIIGLIVDKVLDVVSYPMHAIFLPGDLLPEDLGKISILDGLIQIPEGFMLLLNLKHLFSSQRQQDLAEALNHLSTHTQVLIENQKQTNSASISSRELRLPQDKHEGKSSDGDHEIPQKQQTKTLGHTPSGKESSHENNSTISREEMA